MVTDGKGVGVGAFGAEPEEGGPEKGRVRVGWRGGHTISATMVPEITGPINSFSERLATSGVSTAQVAVSLAGLAMPAPK